MPAVDTIPEEPHHEDDAAKVAKEHPTLSDISLMTLGKAVKDKEKYQLAMRLGIPTTIIVQLKANAEQLGQAESSLGQQYLLDWKRRNTGAKDKDKLVLLEKGFREISKDALADIVRDCGTAEQEISQDTVRQHI